MVIPNLAEIVLQEYSPALHFVIVRILDAYHWYWLNILFNVSQETEIGK